MNYDIKIVGEDEDKGLIEFERLNLLTRSTKEIATKSLMLKLRGYSDISPDKNLKKALGMYLQDIGGNEQEGTLITIDCRHFSETIKGLQLDMFQPKEHLLQLTPMALVIQAFQAALNENNDKDVDKPLLKSLLNFKKNFLSENQIFYLSNRGSIAELKLTKDDFKKIELLEDSIPEPQNVMINGQLDEMKISKSRMGLMTEEGFVNLILKDNSLISELVGFMGKEITIKGKAHYKPSGNVSFVEIIEFSKPNIGDSYFSSVPTAKNTELQLFTAVKNKSKSNSFEALKGLSGLMKDEMNDNDFKEMLKDTHK